MNTPPRILVVDDEPVNVDILQTRLSVHGYEISTASDGEEALAMAESVAPDLMLLDIHMPKIDGFEVCRRLKADDSLKFTPIILVTALADTSNVVKGLDLGADEYLTKPIDHAALVARVKSMLRIKAMHDTVQEQTRELQAQAAELQQWNDTLEQRVKEQVSQLERMGRLKRFFSPQLVERLVASGDESILQSHRREITVVFCDLRGFTAFSERVEPDELMEMLKNYHATLGDLIVEYQGTLERFAGDGVMVFFNDPEPSDDHTERAVRMALAMQQKMRQLVESWRGLGYGLDFSIGIAAGAATLGMIGFEGRNDYAAIGPVTNLAARLCGAAEGGQILVEHRVFSAVERAVGADSAERRDFKGIREPVQTYNITGLND